MSQAPMYQDELGVRIDRNGIVPGNARSADSSGPIPLSAIDSATAQPVIEWKTGLSFVGGGLLIWSIFSGGFAFLIGAAAIGWGGYILLHPSKRSHRLFLVKHEGSDIPSYPMKPYAGQKGKDSIDAMVKAISMAKTMPEPPQTTPEPETKSQRQESVRATPSRLDTITAELAELRKSVEVDPENAQARRELASLLFVGLDCAKDEDRLEVRDALLDELRNVSMAFPDDGAVRDQLGRGLGKTAQDARAEQLPERSEKLLRELRAHTVGHPDEPALRKWLAVTLCGAIVFAKEQGKLEIRDALLDELRQLFRAHPGDAALAAQYARALVNDLLDAENESQLHVLPATVDELRTLLGDFPGDEDVRKQFGLGLMFAIDHSATPRDDLLEELRQLSQEHPLQTDLRETLAFGLEGAIRQGVRDKRLEASKSLLDELRRLAISNIREAIPRACLARSLKVMVIFALDVQQDSDVCDEILDELRQLARRFPEDEDVRVSLGESLIMYIDWSRIQDNGKFGDLMVEVRELSQMKPENKVVWDMFSKYFSSMVGGEK